tara:strand:+ start:11244 stop:11852 length:609 start_codon:yes stop_codon:yes gene_type:complete
MIKEFTSSMLGSNTPSYVLNSLNNLPMSSAQRTEKGDIVKCVTNNLKNFNKNSYYLVGGTKKRYYDVSTGSIKAKGIPGYLSINNFELADEVFIRENNINIILGNENVDVKTTKPQKRKLDREGNKKFILTNLLINKISGDRKRFSYRYFKKYETFPEMVEKIIDADKKYGTKTEDFNDIKDMKVSEFFDLYLQGKLSDSNF